MSRWDIRNHASSFGGKQLVNFRLLFHTTSPLIINLITVSQMSTEKMRAILIKDGKGPIENLYIGETATPVVKSKEVLVKVRAAKLRAPYATLTS
jgi:hypothetical protein